MAHPCLFCGSECYCNGSEDDAVVDKTPKNCTGCGHELCDRNDIPRDDGMFDDEGIEDERDHRFENLDKMGEMQDPSLL